MPAQRKYPEELRERREPPSLAAWPSLPRGAMAGFGP